MEELILVAGARPNFMKVAPILRAVSRRAAAWRTKLLHTGQHYDAAMSDVFFEELGIREPDEHLQVGSGTHGVQTAHIMTAFEGLLLAAPETKRGVVVVGDVNSTMACALVAVKLGVPVAHVEAGLRSFDRRMPEEINRVVTDAICDLLLVSEPAGLENLAREGVDASRVRYVGNVMIDTLVQQLERARKLSAIEDHGLRVGEYALVTLHRPSNVDSVERLEHLVGLLARLAERLPIVFPVHPRTAAKLDEFDLRDGLEGSPGVHLLPPLGYVENLCLMRGAKLVVSDSGGIQEETTYLRVPCITLRDSTERPVTETVGTNTVAGASLKRAWELIVDVLEGRYKQGGEVRGWDGHAAERVVDVLLEAWAE